MPFCYDIVNKLSNIKWLENLSDVDLQFLLSDYVTSREIQYLVTIKS